MELEIEAVSANIDANEEDSFSIKMQDGTRIEIHHMHLNSKVPPTLHVNIRFGARQIRVTKDHNNVFHVEGIPSGNALVE